MYAATANNHNLVFVNFFADCDDEKFFESVKDEITKYDAVFIDEIQDYRPEWIRIIREYFLADGGELVVFGDEKQNIYHREMDKDKMPSTGIAGQWNKLNESHRLTTKIVNLALKLQSYFFKERYAVDEVEIISQPSLFDLQESVDYIHFNPATTVDEICRTIISKIKQLNVQPNDVAILANTVAFLRELEFTYRQETHEKTTIMFETKEIWDELNKKWSGNELKKIVEKIRRGLKFNFWANAGTAKFSTIHSFKGWESSSLFLIVGNEDYLGDERAANEELIYAGITRCRSNLVVINVGNPKYHRFFESSLQGVD